MKVETLKSKNKKHFLYTIILGVVLLLPLILTVTKAKYQTIESIKIAEGTIKNYSPTDLNIVAIKLQNGSGGYDNSNTVPESGYTLNTTESYCTTPDGNGNNVKDSSITINYHDGVVGIDNMTKKGTKCYLYFDTLQLPSEVILANKTISTRNDFSTILSTDTTGTIYTAPDDYGTSYYFAGNPTDNWVKFAGFYWRIIRINGDGTIRMIYQGTSANTTGEGTQIGISKFNSSYNNNMYVGYMYTSGQVHGRGTNSTIKGVLDNWYNSNLASQAGKIATGAGATFCNDRMPSTSGSTSNGSGGTGTTTTYYADFIRLIMNKTPTFKCTDSGDKFDTSVGLITANEVAYAGGVNLLGNSDYYLRASQHYWTMSPYWFRSNNGYATMFYVHSDGSMGFNGVNDARGVRPVINMKADTAFAAGGTGTRENPYVIS